RGDRRRRRARRPRPRNWRSRAGSCMGVVASRRYLERRRVYQRALETERRPQEPITLQIDVGGGAADKHGDGTTAGALVELDRHEVADIHTVVLDDLLSDLCGAVPLRPQGVRHPASLVVRGGLGRILADLQVRPALGALPLSGDLFGVEDAANVLADAATSR